jgi:uncharacterized membrane protein
MSTMPPQRTHEEQALFDGLWNPNATLVNYGDPKQYRDHILQMYQMCVQMADQTSTRRVNTNSFFLSINAAIVAAIGLSYEPGYHFSPRELVIFPLTAVLILCLIWFAIIMYYRRLNEVKFKVIKLYEECLPSRPLVYAEWEAAGQGNQFGRYLSVSKIEQIIPVFFALLYIFGAIAISFY